jgi:hypothetical protein
LGPDEPTRTIVIIESDMKCSPDLKNTALCLYI